MTVGVGPPDGPTIAPATALAEDLAIFENHEPGFAARLAGYVLDGTDAHALKTITTLDDSSDERSYRIVRHYRHPHMRGLPLEHHNGYDGEATERVALAAGRARDAILFGPTPLPVLRRYADLCERVYTNGTRIGTAASPAWLRALFACIAEQGRFSREPLDFGALTAQRLRVLLAAEQVPVAAMVDICFDNDRDATVALGLPGLGALLQDELAAAWPRIAVLPARARASLFERLAKAADPATLPLLLNGIFDTAKAVREAAMLGIKAMPPAPVREAAAGLLEDSDPARRGVAIDLLAALGDRAALEAHAATETSKPLGVKLAQHAARLRTAATIATANPPDGPDGYTALDGSWVAAPPLVPEPDTLPPDAAAAIAALDWVREASSPNVAIGPDCPARLVALMNGEVDPSRENKWLWQSVEKTALLAICTRLDIPLACLTRLYLAGDKDDGFYFLPAELILEKSSVWGVEPILQNRFQAGGDLRHILGATAKTGPSFADNVRRMLAMRVQPPDDAPVNPTIWAAIATDFVALDEVLRKPPAMRWYGDEHALCTLDLFPKTPARYLELLLDRALGGPAKVRAAARRRLEETGDVQRLVAPLLEAKEANARAAAAAWLGQRRDGAAVAPLRAALAGETALECRAAILAALVACGDDVADQFSETTLTAEAEAGLRKTKVDYAALFDSAHLPALRWADGRPVPAIVVRWWFARAHKLKQPAGDPLIHLALDRLDRGDAARLGADVLAAFIAADTRRPDLETANAFAEANAANFLKSHSWVRQDLTLDMAKAIARNKKLATYETTAIGHRGLLALTRHAPLDDAIASTLAFLKQHAKRLPQGKALIEALSSRSEPRALQAIVAISRTQANRGLRKHAAAIVAEVAEADGWSALELADRMMPTAGLDARGGLDLPLAGKMFRAQLGEGATLALLDPDGRAIKALPRATTAEEKAEGAAARKRLAAAGKEASAAVVTVADRFYQAMCGGRGWSAESFAAIVLHHPIASLVAQRLVFVGLDTDGTPQASFRRLADGSLTDVEDETIDSTRFARFAVAHHSTLGNESAAAWRRHFADYDIAPAFDQLGRPLIPPPDSEVRRLDTFAKHVIGARRLAEVAAALGYTRGSVGDPGSFNNYEKCFVDLGLACDISMSDAPVDKTADPPVRLWAASLRRHRPDRNEPYDPNGVRLGRAPPILVSELWHDFKAIADAGSGPSTEDESAR